MFGRGGVSLYYGAVRRPASEAKSTGTRTVLEPEPEDRQPVADVLERARRAVLDRALDGLAVLVVADGAGEEDEVARNDCRRPNGRDWSGARDGGARLARGSPTRIGTADDRPGDLTESTMTCLLALNEDMAMRGEGEGEDGEEAGRVSGMESDTEALAARPSPASRPHLRLAWTDGERVSAAQAEAYRVDLRPSTVRGASAERRGRLRWARRPGLPSAPPSVVRGAVPRRLLGDVSC